MADFGTSEYIGGGDTIFSFQNLSYLSGQVLQVADPDLTKI